MNRPWLVVFLLLLPTLCRPVNAAAQAMAPAPQNSEVAAADELFVSGNLAEAATKYQAIVNTNPMVVAAQVGLIRTYLIQQKLDEAQAAASAALAVLPNAPLLLTTMGDLQFRLGKIPDAERLYLKARSLDPSQIPRPNLGLTRVYSSYSLYRRAYDQMNRARELAPDDFAVQMLWLQSLPWNDRIAAVQSYLAGPGVQNPQMARPLRQYLEFLQRNSDTMGQHPCRLASKVEETNTKLYAIPRAGMQLGASGLVVKLNKQEMHLAVDTELMAS